MPRETVRFYGGPWDGREELTELRPYIEVHERHAEFSYLHDEMVFSIRVTQYRRETINHSEFGQWYCYIHESIPDET